jgi:hypothetical protein
VGPGLDLHNDLAGGCRIPRPSERQARTVAQLRAAGLGVRRVLLAHDGSREAADLFSTVLTLIDPQVTLDLAVPPADASEALTESLEQAHHLERAVQARPTDSLAEAVRAGGYDLVIIPAGKGHDAAALAAELGCRVFVVAPPPERA